MLVSLVLVTAAYVPRNHIRRALGHPMIVGVKVWAFAHLISNGRLVDVMLFGAFLAWGLPITSLRASATARPAPFTQRVINC